jgi:hypothetical protein
METVRLSAHTTAQGHLLLDVPTSLEDSDVEVTVTVQAVDTRPRDHLGWPIGFWERFAGSMPDLAEVEDPPAEDVEPIR